MESGLIRDMMESTTRDKESGLSGDMSIGLIIQHHGMHESRYRISEGKTKNLVSRSNKRRREVWQLRIKHCVAEGSN